MVVKLTAVVRHDGKNYSPGSTLPMNDADALRLIRLGVAMRGEPTEDAGASDDEDSLDEDVGVEPDPAFGGDMLNADVEQSSPEPDAAPRDDSPADEPEQSDAASAPVESIEEMTKAELIAELRSLGEKANNTMSKDELTALLAKARRE